MTQGNGCVTGKWRHGWLGWVLICLTSSVQALGLGNIEVKSGLNQPFLAEIPLVGARPEDADSLEVSLASAEAFAQVGLDAPSGVAANLRFAVIAGADGQPRIQVSAKSRVNDPFLIFLLDVRWQGGRLLREFSVLIDPPYLAPAVHKSVTPAIAAARPKNPPAPEPRSVPAPASVAAPVLEPEIAAPIAEPVPAERELLAELMPVEPPTDASAESEPGESVYAAAEELKPAPAPAPVRDERVVPAPIPSPSTSVMASAAPVSDSSIHGPVQSGETLWQIANQNRASPATINQMMVAILRSNEHAFIDGNINRLKRGEVLRLPSEQEVLSLAVAEVNALVQAQTEAWLGRRQVTAQVVQTEPDSVVAADSAQSTTPPMAPANEGARLKILASEEEAPVSAAQSGIADDGPGSTLVSGEDADEAARVASQARIQELQARLEQLEKIRADSERLLVLRERELAEIQARVSQLEQAGRPLDAVWYNRLWVLAGLALLISGLLALLLIVRRERDAYRLQVRAISAGSTAANWADFRHSPADPRRSQSDEPSPGKVAGSSGLHGEPEAAPVAELNVVAPESIPDSALETEMQSRFGSRGVPGREAPPHGSVTTEDSSPAKFDAHVSAGTGSLPMQHGARKHSGEQPSTIKLELARAYLDIGDARGARALLEEVLTEGDPRFRTSAREMLDELD